MNSRKAKSFRQKWEDIKARKAALDFEEAVLFAEIRAEFPVTSSGTVQCCEWIVENFGVSVVFAKKALRAAKMSKSVSPKKWEILGGFRTVQWVQGLQPPVRRKTMKACEVEFKRRKVKEREAVSNGDAVHVPTPTLSYDTVRRIAFQNGAKPGSLRGRPTRTQAEDKLDTLREYILKLHDIFDLPPLPKNVKDAMGTRLAELKRKVRTRVA